MATILQVDKSQRKIISVLYRITLSVFAIFLYNYFPGELSLLYFSIISIVYFIIFITLIGNNKIKSIIRLLNDYSYIFLLLWYIDISAFFAFSFIFIPILNAQNHSGNSKSILLYLLPVTGLYFFDKYSFTFWILVPFATFYIINKFASLRNKYLEFQQELNTIIDDFFVNNQNLNRSYLIYREIIPLVNLSNIFPYTISDIVCVHIVNNKYTVVNGSSFVWSLIFKEKEIFIKKTAQNKYLSNFEIEVNDVKFTNNFIINCKVNSSTYSYIIIPKGNTRLIYDSISTSIMVKVLTPILTRYSNVLKSNFEHKKDQISKLSLLQEKINYVANSVNSMHFIRNKLGPLKSYLAMVSDYEKSDEKKKLKIEPYIKKEREKLKTSINQILEKADYVLKKSNNPFNVYSVEEYGLQQFFAAIRGVWVYYFDAENFEIDWNIKGDGTKFNVRYNIVGLELVLANWISNMHKYNDGECKIVLTEDDGYYNVNFYNEVNVKEKNIKFIEEYNSSNRTEISRRNSHGLLEMKDFINQMDLISEVSISGNNVHFCLKFKKYIYNEDINN